MIVTEMLSNRKNVILLIYSGAVFHCCKYRSTFEVNELYNVY